MNRREADYNELEGSKPSDLVHRWKLHILNVLEELRQVHHRLVLRGWHRRGQGQCSCQLHRRADGRVNMGEVTMEKTKQGEYLSEDEPQRSLMYWGRQVRIDEDSGRQKQQDS